MKLITAQLVKKLLAFYGIQMFVPIFKETPAMCHDDTAFSPTSHYFKLIRVTNIPNILFLLGLSIKILCAFLISPMLATCFARLNLM
jgi:hypothetical protein